MAFAFAEQVTAEGGQVSTGSRERLMCEQNDIQEESHT
jgi:hypothetical protein